MSAEDTAERLVQAMLELATDWRCWAILRHRDGRLFPGRCGDVRLFGTTMIRLDLPVGDMVQTYAFNVAAVDDVLFVDEVDARRAAKVLHNPRLLRSVMAGIVVDGWTEEPL